MMRRKGSITRTGVWMNMMMKNRMTHVRVDTAVIAVEVGIARGLTEVDPMILGHRTVARIALSVVLAHAHQEEPDGQ